MASQRQFLLFLRCRVLKFDSKRQLSQNSLKHRLPLEKIRKKTLRLRSFLIRVPANFIRLRTKMIYKMRQKEICIWEYIYLKETIKINKSPIIHNKYVKPFLRPAKQNLKKRSLDFKLMIFSWYFDSHFYLENNTASELN